MNLPMHRVVRTGFVLLLGISVVGCSTVGSWFGSSSPQVKPAELTDFKPTVTLARAWEVSVGDGKPYMFAPASDGQFVFAAARDGRVVKVDIASGRESWRVETGKVLSAGVGVGEGLVLVGTPKGEVVALRATDGQPAWTAKLSGEVLTAPVAAAGAVAARSNDGRIFLLDAKDGKPRWSYSRTLPSLILREPGSLALTARALFVGHPGGKLTALALNNGAPAWEANVALPRGATELERISDVTGALAVDESIVCASAFQGRVACFEQANGNPVWAREFSGLSGLDMDARLVYASDEHAMLQSFDKARGTSLWKQDKLRDRALSTPLAMAGHVAVGDYQGYVHVLNAENGALAGRASTDGSAIVAPMLALSRGLVVQTRNGSLYGFKLQ